MLYRSRQQTLKRTLSSAKEGLFGVRIRAVIRWVCINNSIACCRATFPALVYLNMMCLMLMMNCMALASCWYRLSSWTKVVNAVCPVISSFLTPLILLYIPECHQLRLLMSSCHHLKIHCCQHCVVHLTYLAPRLCFVHAVSFSLFSSMRGRQQLSHPVLLRSPNGPNAHPQENKHLMWRES